jgi:hypothetical protein
VQATNNNIKLLQYVNKNDITINYTCINVLT